MEYIYEPIYTKEILIANKEVLIKELYSWLETFRDEVDEEGEPTDIPFDTVLSLIERFESDTCTDEDFVNIDFHLYQINEGKEDDEKIEF